MASVEGGGGATRMGGFSFIHVDELGVRIAPSPGPLEEERLEGLVKFLARVLETLEKAGARGVRLQVDWDGGTVIVRRGRDGLYGVYARG